MTLNCKLNSKHTKLIMKIRQQLSDSERESKTSFLKPCHQNLILFWSQVLPVAIKSYKTDLCNADPFKTYLDDKYYETNIIQ